jgi:hypothetical protein
MTIALRPLSTGELLDRTFSLYRSRFGLFVGIFAIPYLAVLAYQCIGISFRSPRPQLGEAMLTLVWALGALLVTLVASAAAQAATVIAVSHVYLERPATVSDSFSRVKGEIFPVIGLSLVVGMAVGLGFILLIVPGVFLALMWALAVPVKVLEDKGVFDAMSRSSELTQGSRGRIFLIGLLIFALSFGVSALLQIPIFIAAGVSAFSGGARVMGAGWQVASQVATFISQCLVGPVGTIAFSLVYYDQRVRKEAFDLQLMMNTLDAPAIPGSPQQIGA